MLERKIIRTPDEIAACIEGLKREKGRLPAVSMFGGENWKKIDAQIAVLEGKAKADQYYMDEQCEDYEDGDNDIYFAAEEAESWLRRTDVDPLFEEE